MSSRLPVTGSVHYDWAMQAEIARRTVPTVRQMIRSYCSQYPSRAVSFAERQVLVDRLLDGAYPSVVGTCIMMAGFADSGRQAYTVGPRSQEMLRTTSLKGVPLDHLRPPYRCFWVSLPGCPHPVWGGDDANALAGTPRMVPALGAYVFWVGSKLTVQIHGDPGDGYRVDRSMAHSHALISGPTFWWADLDFGHPATVDLFDGDLGNLGSYLAHLIERQCEESDPHAELEGMPTAMRAEHIASVCEIYKIVINLVLYATAANADLTDLSPTHQRERDVLVSAIERTSKAKKRRGLQRQLDALPTSNVTLVAGGYEQSPVEPTTYVTKTGKTRARTMRTGHFHQFRTGPRLDADRNPIAPDARDPITGAPLRPLVRHYVAPTWVPALPDPDGHEVAKRTYTVVPG